MFLHSGQKRKSSGTAWFVETCSCNKFEHIAVNTHKHTCPAALVHVVSCRPNHSFIHSFIHVRCQGHHPTSLQAQSMLWRGSLTVSFSTWHRLSFHRLRFKDSSPFEGTADLIGMEEVGFHVISKLVFLNQSKRNRKMLTMKTWSKKSLHDPMQEVC